MGVRFPSVQSNTFLGPLPASNVETVVLVSPPLTPSQDGAIILIFWTAVIIPGTGTASLQFNIRRGTTASGAQFLNNRFVNAVTAGAQAVTSGFYFDVPGPVGGQQYALTCVQQTATAAGTWQDGAIFAFAL